MPYTPSSVTIFTVTKFLPGQDVMTLTSTIRISGEFSSVRP